MELNLTTTVFAIQLEVVSASKESVTIRTKDVIPFLGDVLATEVTLADLNDEAITTLDRVEDNDWLFITEGNKISEQAVNNAVMDLASRNISKDLQNHVFGVLNGLSREMGQEELTPMWG